MHVTCELLQFDYRVPLFCTELTTDLLVHASRSVLLINIYNSVEVASYGDVQAVKEKQKHFQTCPAQKGIQAAGIRTQKIPLRAK